MSVPSTRLYVLSQRSLSQHLSRCAGYGFEDVLTNGIENTKLLTPNPSELLAKFLKAAIRSRSFDNISAKLLQASGLARKLGSVDLLFVPVAQARDLYTLALYPTWRAESQVAICWIHELWIEDLPHLSWILRKLQQFDVVICSLYHTAVHLTSVIPSAKVLYLPWGVDTLQLAPPVEMSGRAIDVTSFGSIARETHIGFLNYAQSKPNGFYFFDTEIGPRIAKSHSEHRLRYASLLKNTRYFVCHLAKVEALAERGAQVEFGLRYFEGIAAGCTLIGTTPNSPAFREYFDTDAVIDMPFVCPDVKSQLEHLDGEAAALREISKKHVIQALERHDHVHRWNTILDTLGLSEKYRLKGREEKLRAAIAERVQSGDAKYGAEQSNVPI